MALQQAQRRQRLQSRSRIRGLKVAGIGFTLLVGFANPSLGAANQTPASLPTGVASAPNDFPPGSPCPIQGDSQGDPDLNTQKNRFVAPTAAEITPNITAPADMIGLAQPRELQSARRADWPNDSARSQVTTLEGQAATIEGYLVRAIEENTGTGESCNCHNPQVLFDYHLYLADQPGVSIDRAIVVEMTPRWRSVNPTWGTSSNGYSGFSVIEGLVGQRVRVTGWLLFDEEHLDQVGKYRATVWEIHPVTLFEYQKDGNWMSL